MDTRVAVISIIVENPEAIETLNHLLHEAGQFIIGEVTEEQPGKVVMLTEIGTQALLPQPGGELLPRIC